MGDKSNMITLRLNNDQINAINTCAKQHDVSVSQVIRAAIEKMTGAKS
jgi:predicted DNA binding CopG/RHH family protein